MTLDRQAMIGQQGDVVIPEPIRDALNLRPGTVLSFSAEDDRIAISPLERGLDAFTSAVEKQPQPENVDWDERYFARPER